MAKPRSRHSRGLENRKVSHRRSSPYQLPPERGRDHQLGSFRRDLPELRARDVSRLPGTNFGEQKCEDDRERNLPNELMNYTADVLPLPNSLNVHSHVEILIVKDRVMP